MSTAASTPRMAREETEPCVIDPDRAAAAAEAGEEQMGPDAAPDCLAATTSRPLLHDVKDPDDPEPPAEALCCCLRWKAPIILAGWTLLQAIPAMLTRPLLIDVQKEYFGSDQKAAMITSVVASVVAFINMFLIVTYGRLLDSLGRRPFFIAASLFSVATYVSLAAAPHLPIIYVVVQGCSNFIQSSFQGAWLADFVAPEHRSFAFTIVAATGNISMLASLPVALIKASNMVFYIAAVAFSVVGLVYTFFLIPESLPLEKRKAFDPKGVCRNPLAGAKPLVRSRAMLMIAGIACIVVTADVGTADIYMYYLNQRVGFNKQDNAYFFVEMSLLSLIGYFVGLPLLQRFLSAVTILGVAIGGNATLLILVATIWAKWGVFALIAPTYMVLVLGNPVLNAMITNIGHERDVGKRLTAMTAVTDFCNAVGPLVFGILYGELPPALIALPFFVFGGLCYATVVLIWTRLGPAIRDDQEQTQRELLEEAIARGEDPLNGDEAAGADAPTGASPVAIGRTMYDDDDCR